MLGYGIAAGVAVVLLLVFFGIGAATSRQARLRFNTQAERLRADFFAAAASSGKPRGLRWKALEWAAQEPLLARDRASGEIVALAALTIQFEAIAGSDMEGLPAVGNLRNASAVFFYRRGAWHTTGKAVFNLNPEEALAHFKDRYEPLAG